MKKLFLPFALLMLLFGVLIFYQSGEQAIDPKTSIEQGIKEYKKGNALTPEEEIKVKLELALANYIAEHFKPPTGLIQLVPKYLDSVPINPTTHKPFEYRLVGEGYELGDSSSNLAAKSDQDVIDEDFVNPNKMVVEDYVYDSTDKRDPFKPFTDKEEVVIDESTPPILRYDISQLRVAAILTDSQGGRFAMVEDSAGIGYPVKSGDPIGNKQGKVISVQADKVEVLETLTDAAGQTKQELRSIKLVSGGGEASKLKNQPKPKRRR